MNPFTIIEKYYSKNSDVYTLLLEHSKMVAKKALDIAERLNHFNPDRAFIEEAALLHDIGIFGVHEPKIYCFGEKPYVCHGYLGREILVKEGLPRHAIVCETHVGVGISQKEIQEKQLPLPERDMIPRTLEEQIICYADKFFSKHPDQLYRQKSIPEIRQNLLKYGKDKVDQFNEWVERFET